MLRHNPEVQTQVEKLARYDDESIEKRIDFIQEMLDDKDLEWSKDGEAEQMHPANDGDFMATVEKRAEEGRENSRMKEEVIKEMDTLQLEQVKRSKAKHQRYLNK